MNLNLFKSKLNYLNLKQNFPLSSSFSYLFVPSSLNIKFNKNYSINHQQIENLLNENPNDTTKSQTETTTTKERVVVESAPIKDDLDFDDQSLSPTSSSSSLNETDKSFKYDELILCKSYTKKYKNSDKLTCRLIKLEKNGIFMNRTMDVFHEHIINKSRYLNRYERLNNNKSQLTKFDLNVGFELYSNRVYFKRPTLYEYISLKEQQAVSSHFSIITLVPMLLEVNKNSRILECGTGSGSMTLFLSERLGRSGVLHTFDITSIKTQSAKEYFRNWKSSYDLTASNEYEKWPHNVKFGTIDLSTHKFNDSFNEFYDAIYLDMANLDKAIENVYRLLKIDGTLVINAMHLTQVLKCLNVIRNKNIGLENELLIEPANRFWELRKILLDNRFKNKKNGRETGEHVDVNNEDANLNSLLDWTCRLEDRFSEKYKRGRLYFNYWSGFLVKFRKIK